MTKQKAIQKGEENIVKGAFLNVGNTLHDTMRFIKDTTSTGFTTINEAHKKKSKK